MWRERKTRKFPGSSIHIHGFEIQKLSIFYLVESHLKAPFHLLPFSFPSAELLKNKKKRKKPPTWHQQWGKIVLSQYFLSSLIRFLNNKKGICLNIKLLKIVTHRIAVLSLRTFQRPEGGREGGIIFAVSGSWEYPKSLLVLMINDWREKKPLTERKHFPNFHPPIVARLNGKQSLPLSLHFPVPSRNGLG